MAWIRAMGGGTPAKLKIYDNGTWGVAYDNPGTWSTGSSINAASLNPTTFTLTGTASPARSAVIGTSNAIDLTPYTMLKIKTRVTGSAFAFGVYDDKVVNSVVHQLAQTIIDVNSDFTEYVVDVTSLTSGYIAFWCGDGSNRTATVSEITLE